MNNYCSIEGEALLNYLKRQIQNFFPDNKGDNALDISVVKTALSRTLHCFSNINSTQYTNDIGVSKFNHLHGDHYACFLYYVSRVGYERGIEAVYFKAALLNKALNGIDLFGHVDMPEHFLLVHPLGSIIGRAKFMGNLVIYQNVTIGGKHNENDSISYPTIGKDVVLYSDSSVIGDAHIGDKCVVAAGTKVMSRNLRDEGKIILGTFKGNHTKDLKITKKFFTY
ncbi:MAG: serine O-acetyltransferase [Algoriphagus sp.]|jgi:serine O-acetyltransferase